MSKEEDNKAVVVRWFTEFWGKDVNLGVVDEIADPDMLLKYSLHEPRRGHDDIKAFMTEHGMTLYTEHLSWCADDTHLYDLLPIPMTESAVKWTAERIQRAQDILGMRIGIENASYYVAPPGAEMSESEFISAIVHEADCLLHLDVNNIYVNSRNFGFDPLAFMTALPLERTCYVHVAGHWVEPDGLLIDTHGAEVIDPVWGLLAAAYARIGGDVPTCLERDFNIPDLPALTAEVEQIAQLQAAAVERKVA